MERMVREVTNHTDLSSGLHPIFSAQGAALQSHVWSEEVSESAGPLYTTYWWFPLMFVV